MNVAKTERNNLIFRLRMAGLTFPQISVVVEAKGFGKTSKSVAYGVWTRLRKKPAIDLRNEVIADHFKIEKEITRRKNA